MRPHLSSLPGLLGDTSPVAGARDTCRDRWVIAFAVTALLVQLLYRTIADPVVGIGDQIGYQAGGHDLGAYWAAGPSGPDNVLRMPGYHVFLWLSYSFGLGDGAVQVEQAILLAAGCLAVAGVAGLVAGQLAARIAAGSYAFYLPLLSFSTVFLTEAFSIALTLFGVLLGMIALTDRERLVPAGAGAALLLSVAAFSRPNLVVTFAVVALGLLLSARSIRQAATVVAAVMVPFALLFGPWVARNLDVVGRPAIFGSVPAALAIGAHLPVDDEMGPLAAAHRYTRFYAGQRADGFTFEKAMEADAGATLRKNLTERPLDFLGSRLVLLGQTWLWPESARNDYGRNDPVPYGAVMALHLLIVFGGLAGLVRKRRTVGGRLLLATVLATGAPYLLFYPEPRYVLPALPWLMVGLGVALAPLVRLSRAWLARRGVGGVQTSGRLLDA